MTDNTIIFSDSVESILPDQLENFFVGWDHRPSPEILFTILKNSEHVVVAFDTEKNMVVGFINCIADGILSAYIPLLEVLPEYQNMGIGVELTKRMLDLTKKYYMTDLCCDEALATFYEKFGMKKTVGMIRRNYDRLNTL